MSDYICTDLTYRINYIFRSSKCHLRIEDDRSWKFTDDTKSTNRTHPVSYKIDFDINGYNSQNSLCQVIVMSIDATNYRIKSPKLTPCEIEEIEMLEPSYALGITYTSTRSVRPETPEGKIELAVYTAQIIQQLSWPIKYYIKQLTGRDSYFLDETK